MATFVNSHDILPLIYEAARDKNAYGTLLESIMLYFNSDKGGLQIEDLRKQQVQSGGVFFGYDQTDLDTYMEYYSTIEPWTPRLLEKVKTTHASFLRSDDLMPIKDYQKTEFYNDWGKPLNLNHTIGCVLQLTEDLSLKITVQKGGKNSYTRQDMHKANLLWPYLTQLLNLVNTSEIWKKKQTHYWVIDQTHKVQESATPLHLDSSILNIKEIDGKLKINHHQANDEIASAFKLLLANKMFQPKRIRLSDSQYLVLQAHQSMADMVHSAKNQLLIYIKIIPSPDILSKHFQMPIKKANLLHCILEGKTIQEAAANLHCSIHTARAALKQLFLQFGVQSQTQLIHCINQNVAQHNIICE